MKTYLLRDTHSVEPQKARFVPVRPAAPLRPPPPAVPALFIAIPTK